MKTTLILFVASFAVVAGCRTSTSPGNSTGMPITQPGQGSYFVLASTYSDSNGVAFASDTTVETFVKTGLTIAGKTNVNELVDSSSYRTSAAGYIHYESNGDVSAYYPGDTVRGIFGSWIVYPFGTQGTNTYTIDTSLYGTSVHIQMTLAGAGSGTSKVKGQPVSTEKVSARFFDVISRTNAGKTFRDTLDETSMLSLAPSLGDVVEQSTPGSRDSFTGKMGESSHEIVVDYLLK